MKLHDYANIILSRTDYPIKLSNFEKFQAIWYCCTTKTYMYTNLDTNSTNQCFQHVIICSYKTQLLFIQCCKFTAVEGTFLIARFVQTLLLAIGIDLN